MGTHSLTLPCLLVLHVYLVAALLLERRQNVSIKFFGTTTKTSVTLHTHIFQSTWMNDNWLCICTSRCWLQADTINRWWHRQADISTRITRNTRREQIEKEFIEAAERQECWTSFRLNAYVAILSDDGDDDDDDKTTIELIGRCQTGNIFRQRQLYTECSSRLFFTLFYWFADPVFPLYGTSFFRPFPRRDSIFQYVPCNRLRIFCREIKWEKAKEREKKARIFCLWATIERPQHTDRRSHRKLQPVEIGLRNQSVQAKREEFNRIAALF